MTRRGNRHRWCASFVCHQLISFLMSILILLYIRSPPQYLERLQFEFLFRNFQHNYVLTISCFRFKIHLSRVAMNKNFFQETALMEKTRYQDEWLQNGFYLRHTRNFSLSLIIYLSQSLILITPVHSKICSPVSYSLRLLINNLN